MKKHLFEWINPKRKRSDSPTFEAQLIEQRYPSSAPIDRYGLPEPTDRRHAAQRNIIVLGNCQARPLAACLQALSPNVVANGIDLPLSVLADRVVQRDPGVRSVLLRYDHILLQPFFAPLIRENFPEVSEKVRLFPTLVFSAFHPDLVYIHINSTRDLMRGPLGEYHSAIALWGFVNGRSVMDTIALFNESTYGRLGYFRFWDTSCQGMLDEGALADLPLDVLLAKWSRSGCFMHSINHPKLFALADVAEALLAKLGLPTIPGAADYLADEHAEGPVWPVYPEIAQPFGITGHYHFKIERGRSLPDRPVIMLSLRDFVEASFAAFGKHAKGDLICERMALEAYRALESVHAPMISRQSSSAEQASARAVGRSQTPYTGLPIHHFWKGAVAGAAVEELDPVVSVPFQLSRSTRVATAGSCFAQHISATLRRHGLNYYITEAGEDLPLDEARRRQYGLFSARFGNLYTARQLLQLFERAYGEFVPDETHWRRANGRYADPFRPQIEPDGYESPEAVATSRAEHLGAVRQMLEGMDVLIFTLGLTEAWRSKADGAVFPLAPGVAAGVMDPARYEFVNFRVHDVVADLQRFLTRLNATNPRARVIFTVSPVPLAATYESQHVLVATTYSKSVLRAAATEICSQNKNCSYFPSYEIITGNYTRGVYYEPDLRSITSAGIDHVMRVFLRHYADSGTQGVDAALLRELRAVKEIVCDEEAIHR